MPTLLLGSNFSGRSSWLEKRRRERKWPASSVLGPLGDTTCTGLAWTVREELSVAATACGLASPRNAALIQQLGLAHILDHELNALSGGEGIRVGLASAISQGIRELHIDTALEQLDHSWRQAIMSILCGTKLSVAEAIFVADNHLTSGEISAFSETLHFPLKSETNRYARATMDVAAATTHVGRSEPMQIIMECVSFAYPRAKYKVFENVSLKLEPGNPYLLIGANGSGKSTLVKLLSGTILPQDGTISFGSNVFRAGRSTRRYAALAFQNPDYQWTAQTVLSELRRLRGQDPEDVATFRHALSSFGIPPDKLDSSPIELPFVLKKRFGIVQAVVAAKPWLILDEPTLGQDLDFRRALAKLVQSVLASGAGVLIISHDEYFRSLVPTQRRLIFENRTVTLEA